MKKFIMFFTLVAFTMSIGVVGVSAATSAGSQRLVSAGLPIDVTFVMQDGTLGYISQANTWLQYQGAAYNYNTTQAGFNPQIVFTDDTQTPSATDLQIRNFAPAKVASTAITTPFNPWNMSTTEFELLVTNIGLGWRGPATGIVSIPITRTYTVRVPAQTSGGGMNWYNITKSYTTTLTGSVTADTVSWIQYASMTKAELNNLRQDFANDGYDFEQAVVTNVTTYIDNTDIPAGRVTNLYLNSIEYDDPLLANIRQIAMNSLGTLYQIDIAYDNLDWTKWLSNAVGGFMEFELVPGLPLYGIVSAIIGIPLLIWFLRLFAGG